MLNWITGALFFIAGFITSFFVPHEALNFSIVQMVIAVFLFTILIFMLAIFWPKIKSWFKRK